MFRALILFLGLFSTQLTWADEASFQAKADDNLKRAFSQSSSATQSFSVQLNRTPEQEQNIESILLARVSLDKLGAFRRFEKVLVTENYVAFSQIACGILLDPASQFSIHGVRGALGGGGGTVIVQGTRADAVLISESPLVAKLIMNINVDAAASTTPGAIPSAQNSAQVQPASLATFQAKADQSLQQAFQENPQATLPIRIKLTQAADYESERNKIACLADLDARGDQLRNFDTAATRSQFLKLAEVACRTFRGENTNLAIQKVTRLAGGFVSIDANYLAAAQLSESDAVKTMTLERADYAVAGKN